MNLGDEFVYPEDEAAKAAVDTVLAGTVKKNLEKNIKDESMKVEKVDITSVNGISRAVSANRRLTQGEVLWEAVMEAVTTVITVMTDGKIVSASVNGEDQPLNSIAAGSSATVVDAVAGTDAIGDLFLASVTQAMDSAIAPSATGETSFLATFREVATTVAAASGDAALSAALTALAENIAVPSATTVTQEVQPEQQVTVSAPVTEIIEVLLSVVNPVWYPDWSTSRSHKCLNDGNAPSYMERSGQFFESSLSSCCERFFGWSYATCAGAAAEVPTGFYPSWDTDEVKCLNATDTMPDYMRKNPESWLSGSAESCCKRHYNWDQRSCVAKTKGNALSVFTGKFYVNHRKQRCQGDCPDGEGGGYCGGPVDSWNALYDTAEECCKETLGWIAAATCAAESHSGGGTSSSFTGKFYVNHKREICQQDCPDGEEEGRCGGPADSWNTLYATAKECCEENLGWIATSTCEAHSGLGTVTGTSYWYVDWKKTKCVKDCNNASDVNCGGLVRGDAETLYGNAADCCARLDWVPQSDCTT